MPALRFAPLTEGDMVELLQWHQDGELARRYGGSDWPRQLQEVLRTDPARSCWVVWKDGKRVGYLDFERHPAENLAWIGLAVAPDLRGKGLGRDILQMFLRESEAMAFREIRAGIEPDNAASVAVFSSSGFVPMRSTPDEEGIIDYSFIRQ